MAEKIQKYEGENIVVYFEGSRCIHAARCVSGLPNVFKANVPGPWIEPDAADVDELAALIKTCPSGALRYERKDNGVDESKPAINSISVVSDGPLAINGDLIIGKQQGSSTRATLCRCGASKNKPYCDNSHKGINFRDNGTPETGDLSLDPQSAPLNVAPIKDGPLMVEGPVEIRTTDDAVVNRVDSIALCRCGASKNKPYCDGSHALIGFKAE